MDFAVSSYSSRDVEILKSFVVLYVPTQITKTTPAPPTKQGSTTKRAKEVR